MFPNQLWPTLNSNHQPPWKRPPSSRFWQKFQMPISVKHTRLQEWRLCIPCAKVQLLQFIWPEENLKRLEFSTRTSPKDWIASAVQPQRPKKVPTAAIKSSAASHHIASSERLFQVYLSRLPSGISPTWPHAVRACCGWGHDSCPRSCPWNENSRWVQPCE